MIPPRVFRPRTVCLCVCFRVGGGRGAGLSLCAHEVCARQHCQEGQQKRSRKVEMEVARLNNATHFSNVKVLGDIPGPWLWPLP